MTVRLLWVASLVAIVCLPLSAAAQQTGTVSGTLINGLSGDVIPNAVVVLESPSLTRQARSGSDGTYSISEVPPGMYHLIIRADGYLPSRTEVTVASSTATRWRPRS